MTVPLQQDTVGIKIKRNKDSHHTKRNCKYHIVFAPKYRRKVFYGQHRAAIGKILRQLEERDMAVELLKKVKEFEGM